MTIAERLARMGLELPAPAAPAANYLPYVWEGQLLFVSGQLPFEAGSLAVRGKLGDGVSVEDGQRAARLCAISILALIKVALEGDLERIRQVVRITGFVASAPHFTEQPRVVNGASDLLVEALGDRGRHARAAVGMAALPFDAAVEVDAIVAVG